MANLRIVAEDLAIAPGSSPYNGRIVAREDLTPTVATFRVALDAAPFPFEPGQYIAIGLELSRGLVQRPYSIAPSALRLGDGYELYIRKVPGGAFTPSLFASGVGQRLLVRRPKGRFVLDVDDQRTHLFVATGCGLAPFLAMVRTLLDQGQPRRVVLLHGVSYVAELGYRALLEDWEHSGALPLRYLPTLSRPGAPENAGWQGRTGRAERQLPQVLDDFGLTPQDTVVYLCGNPEMVGTSRNLLVARGFSEDHVRSELYWPAAIPRSG
jgi:ferredoxin--NADP+ reductase